MCPLHVPIVYADCQLHLSSRLACQLCMCSPDVKCYTLAYSYPYCRGHTTCSSGGKSIYMCLFTHHVYNTQFPQKTCILTLKIIGFLLWRHRLYIKLKRNRLIISNSFMYLRGGVDCHSPKEVKRSQHVISNKTYLLY